MLRFCWFVCTVNAGRVVSHGTHVFAGLPAVWIKCTIRENIANEIKDTLNLCVEFRVWVFVFYTHFGRWRCEFFHPCIQFDLLSHDRGFRKKANELYTRDNFRNEEKVFLYNLGLTLFVGQILDVVEICNKIYLLCSLFTCRLDNIYLQR